MKRFATFGLSLLMVLSLFLTPLAASAAETQSPAYASNYYYKQLTTPEAKAIYEQLETMDLKSGTASVTISSNESDQDVIMADFISARDAFMLDNAALFYVDFDLLTVTHENGQTTMGPGRKDTYLRDGFTADSVAGAVNAFDEAVASIAAAPAEATTDAKVRAAYDAVIAKTKYALEKDAKPENVPYIRTPYGALVKGESVCKGYARALKAVLDKMGIESVLVQGTFVDGKFNRPHMWNYVRMDDNHWYLLDATMEDGMVGTSNAADDYFLKGSLDKGIDCYFPDGKVSMSELSFNFNYPDLSMAAYQPLTNAFSEDATTKFVSYQGMGLTKPESMESISSAPIMVLLGTMQRTFGNITMF